MALAPARPAAAELRDMPARWPEQTVARNYNRSDIGGHTPIVPDDTGIEIWAIEEHSRDIGIAHSKMRFRPIEKTLRVSAPLHSEKPYCGLCASAHIINLI